MIIVYNEGIGTRIIRKKMTLTKVANDAIIWARGITWLNKVRHEKRGPNNEVLLDHIVKQV